MLDFHSHILYDMDDGAKTIEESLKLLNKQEEEGVDTLVLTPHFYALYEDMESFLKRRELRYRELKESYKGSIKMLLGSEVYYFPNIERNEDVDKLCIEGTDLLLLELPYSNRIDLNKVLILNQRLQVVLAHIERYLHFYSEEEILKLVNNGIYLQMNIEDLVYEDEFMKSLIEKGYIHFLGSDSHNLTYRIPNMSVAKRYFELNYSQRFLNELDTRAKELLGI
ncbi:MAG: PHP domain-containing protein [Erysipelotrichaceae bacterium]|nr:PHP domain-containing protein [Erysipelotrichaceae bacterium]